MSMYVLGRHLSMMDMNEVDSNVFSRCLRSALFLLEISLRALVVA